MATDSAAAGATATNDSEAAMAALMANLFMDLTPGVSALSGDGTALAPRRRRSLPGVTQIVGVCTATPSRADLDKVNDLRRLARQRADFAGRSPATRVTSGPTCERQGCPSHSTQAPWGWASANLTACSPPGQ